MMAAWMHNTHAHRLRNLDQWAPFFPAYADAIYKKTNGYANCMGFIDGKDWKCCKPVRMQKTVYTGHKKIHGIKAQSLILPNGIIGHFFGPVVCSRHDSYLLQCSGLVGILRHISTTVLQTVIPFAAYGDPAYPLSTVLLKPFAGVLTPGMQDLNAKMSSGRITVEWGFGRVTANFPFVQHYSRLQLLKKAVNHRIYH